MAGNFIHIELDTQEPFSYVSPSGGNFPAPPVTIFFTSNEPGDVYIKRNNQPEVGDPETDVYSTPFAIILENNEKYIFNYFIMDGAGNRTPTRTIIYQVGEESAPTNGWIHIDLQTTPPHLVVSPVSGAIGPSPLTIYFTSGDYSKVYIKKDGFPAIGDPETDIYETPFELVLTEEGEYTLRYFAVDDVGNRTDMSTLVYTVGQEFQVYSISPRVGPTKGGTTLIVKGQAFSSETKVLIDNIEIPTKSGSDNGTLIARTLKHEKGSFDIEIVDPIQGRSQIFLGGYTFFEVPVRAGREKNFTPGEERKYIFNTNRGPHVLLRKLYENYDVDKHTELECLNYLTNEKFLQEYGDYPQEYKY